MVSVADKKAELEEFEWFQGIEDDVDELGVDILKLGDFGTVIDDFNCLVSADCNQRLITFELLKEVMNWRIDDRYNIDNLPHDLILDVDVTLGLDDLDVDVVILFLIVKNWVLWMQLMSYFWNWVLNPNIIRVNHWFYALEVGQ